MTFHGFKVETPFVAPKCVVTEACPSGGKERKIHKTKNGKSQNTCNDALWEIGDVCSDI